MIRFEGAVIDHRQAEMVGRVIGVDPDERARVGIWQAVHEHRADDADHRGRRPEADANRQDDRGRQRRHARQAADAVTKVAPEMLHGVASRNRRPEAVDQEMPGVNAALVPEPAVRRARAVVPAPEFMQLGEVGVDRASILVADEQMQQPAHIRPCGWPGGDRAPATGVRARCDGPSGQRALVWST